MGSFRLGANPSSDTSICVTLAKASNPLELKK